MERKDNYLLQVEQARRLFLRYSQEELIRKLKLRHDEMYLYSSLFGRTYRIRRQTGNLEGLVHGQWKDANTHGEYMTLMDLICDSHPDRFTTGNWKTMVSFGKLFHGSLFSGKDTFAEAIRWNPEGFHRACRSLGGIPQKIGDISYAVEVFDGLHICLQFWEADEDFPAQVAWFWDENALMYLKYETMYFAVGLIKERILDEMKTLTD